MSEAEKQFGRTAQGYLESATHAGGDDLDWLMAEVGPGIRRALDLATGGGHTAYALARRVEQVVAVDITPEMLELVQSEARARGLTNLTVARYRAEELAFEDGAFDLVTCRIAAHHFTDLEAALAEVARVLVAGGTFLLEDNTVPEDEAIDSFINALEKLRDPSHVRSRRPSEWQALLAAAGFKVSKTALLRKRHQVKTWVERALEPGPTRDLAYERLRCAEPAVREYLHLTTSDGWPVTFEDEKLMISARRG
ncbi:MAG: class I SAM-dependent methyltransferase [Candidatus Eremiobacteraeota bacterium]|nr:class I SAM-dependent methyltransferase [Candidatus Eremiobacteraeota bacterium]